MPMTTVPVADPFDVLRCATKLAVKTHTEGSHQFCRDSEHTAHLGSSFVVEARETIGRGSHA